MIKISVIIPTYKPQEYLWECLNSLKNQSISANDFEIVIVLNGCAEPYDSQIRNYISSNLHDYHVTYLQTAIGGVSYARNLGLEKAIGEYICFIDDDDLVTSDYLEELLKVSSSDFIGVSNVHLFTESIMNCNDIFFACRIIQQQNKQKGLFYNRAILSFPCAKMIHRQMIGNHLFDIRFKNGEDALFMTQISDKILGFNFTPLSTCYYVRERSGSATRHKIINKKRFIIDAFLLIKAYVSTYISSPRSYNLLLFLSRIPGVIKNALLLLWNNK